MKRSVIRSTLLLVAAAGVSRSAASQSVRAADSLLQRGELDRAESLYYATARTRPRDPIARWGLGRYLAARGAPRIAVTLFEEALQFGGDPAAIVPDLAPLYLALGEYHALAALPSSFLTPDERERARWLEAHPTRLIAPDSVIVVTYRDSADEGGPGRMPIRINGRTVDAVIDVTTRGVIISDSAAARFHLRTFGPTPRPTPPTPAPRGARSGFAAAVADSIGVGRLSYMSFPISIQALGVPAIIGLDVLARFAPTFDPRAGRVTLRASGVVSQSPQGASATLTQPADVLIAQGGGWASLRSTPIARMLRQHRWTLDTRRGQIIIEP